MSMTIPKEETLNELKCVNVSHQRFDTSCIHPASMPSREAILEKMDNDCLVQAPNDGDTALSSQYNYMIHTMPDPTEQRNMIDRVTGEIIEFLDQIEDGDLDEHEHWIEETANLKDTRSWTWEGETLQRIDDKGNSCGQGLRGS